MSQTRNGRHRRAFRLLTAPLALIAVLVSSLVVPVSAFAADSETIGGNSSIRKWWSGHTPGEVAPEVAPGDVLDYYIEFQCTEVDFPAQCTNVLVEDVVPPEFIVDRGVGDANLILTGALAGSAIIGGSGQTVTLAFSTALPAGSTHTLTIPVTVDPDLPYSASGVPVENTATIRSNSVNYPVGAYPDGWENASSQTLTPIVPLELAADVDKAFTPEQAFAVEGQGTLVNLSASNESNAPVDSLTVLDPSDPALWTGANTGNPFHYLSPSGAASVTSMPAGADRARYDLYIEGTGWILGQETSLPASGGTLPVPDPSPASYLDVDAVRIVFDHSAGGQLGIGATADFQLNVQQNANVVGIPDTVVTNVAGAYVTLGGDDSPTDTDPGTYTIGSGALDVTAGKSFTPSAVTLGGETRMTLYGRNDADDPVNRLILIDNSDGTAVPSGDPPHSMWHDGVTIDDWDGPIVWPSGATEADVTFEYLDVSGVDAVAGVYPTYTKTVSGWTGAGTLPPIADRTTNPANPFAPNDAADVVVGFGVGFTGTDIAVGASASIPIAITTPDTAHPDPDAGMNGVQWPNQLDVITEVYADDIVTGTPIASGLEVATATLTTYEDILNLLTEKRINPDLVLGAQGNNVIVQLETTVAPYPDSPADLAPPVESFSTVGAEEIVIQDPVTPLAGSPTPGGPTWWDNLTASAITQTEVPSNGTLLIEYWDTSQPGVDKWRTLAGPFDGSTDPVVNHAIAPAIQSVIGGLRFTYTADPGTTFAPGASVQPNYSAAFRANVFGTGPDYDPVPFVNDFTADAYNGPLVATDGGDDGIGAQPIDDPDGVGPDIEKDWLTAAVTERTRGTADVGIGWSTGGLQNLGRVEIVDVADPDGIDPLDVGATVYDAFDLHSIRPITTGSGGMDPLLRYDQIERVDLWNGTAWTPAANFAGPWDGGSGTSFPGVTLTPAERASTLGVRITVVESPTRATTALGDPLAPQPGTGVASSMANDRELQLRFQLRDLRRSIPTEPVLGVANGTVYNTGTAGEVLNDAGLYGYALPVGGAPVADSQDDDVITILDATYNVQTTKTWAGGPMAVPPLPPEVPYSSWPTGRVSLTASNDSGAAYVDTLTVADPILVATGNAAVDASCAPADALDPFDAFDLLDVISISTPAGAVAAQTVITLDRSGALPDLVYSGATAVSDVLDLTAAELADVVGMTFEFNGRINPGASTSIVYDTKLRTHLRGAGTPVLSGYEACNVVRAVLEDAGLNNPLAPPTEFAADSMELEAVDIDLEVTKSIAANTAPPPPLPAHAVVEPSTGPLTVTLTGQPGGTSRAVYMELVDDDPRFWNQYDLAALDDIAFSAPIERVRVDALTGGTWTLPDTCSPTPAGGCGPVTDGGTWQIGDETTGPGLSLPTDVDPEDVQGLRFVFTKADGSVWENPDSPIQTVRFEVVRRASLHTGGPVLSDMLGNAPAPGEDDAGTATNLLDGLVRGDDVVGGEPIEAVDDDDAVALYRHAVNALSVEKRVNGNPSGAVLGPGSTLTYQLVVNNSGNVPVDDLRVVDDLPVDGAGGVLVFDPNADPGGPGPYAYALSGGGGMPTDADDPAIEVVVTDHASGGLERIAWDFPGSSLAPGETFTISVVLAMRPGLAAGTYLNAFGAAGERPLDQCNGAAVAPADSLELCTDDVPLTVNSAANLASRKYVRAVGADHGVFSTVDSVDCAAPMPAGHAAEDFWPQPCVPRTEPGQSETWRMVFTNTGNADLIQVRGYDRLPAPGDVTATTLLPRQSQWRPVLAGMPTLVGSATTSGATLTVHYITDATVDGGSCTTSNNLVTACPEPFWTLMTGDESDAVLATVRALRYTVSFADANSLLGAEEFAIDMTTRTPPYGAAIDVDQVAYNSVAAIGWPRGGAYPALGVPTQASEGGKVGVALVSGEIQVEKIVTDPYGFMPSGVPYDLTVVCSSLVDELGLPIPSPGIPIPLGPLGDVTITPDVAPLSPAIEGIPYGAECTSEPDDAALPTEFSATTVTVGDHLVDPIQVITATNRYGRASLELEKEVSSPAADRSGTPIVYGPFDFRVRCDFLGTWYAGAVGGVPLALDADGWMTVSLGAAGLGDGAGDTLRLTGLPARSTCEVEETGTYEAAATTLTATVGVLAPVITAGTATQLDLAEDGAADAVTNFLHALNAFGAGELEIAKVVTGAGAAFGVGPFTMHVECTLGSGADLRTVWAEDVVLGGGEPLSKTISGISSGADCDVVETATGGATTVAYSALPVAIADGGSASVTVTNTFDVGQIDVSKTVTGPGAALYGAGPFLISASCEFDGSPITVPAPGPERTVVDGDSVSYAGLPIGAECVITEPGTGGATSTTIEVVGGGGSSGDAETGAEAVVAAAPIAVDVTNDFQLAELRVTKGLLGEVDGHAGGSFTFELVCTRDVNGVATAFPIPDGADPDQPLRTLSAATGWEAGYEDLPPGAECVLTERETGGADRVGMAIAGGAFALGASQSFALPEAGAVAGVVNAWGALGVQQIELLAGTGSSGAAAAAAVAAVLLALGGLLLWAERRRRRARG